MYNIRFDDLAKAALRRCEPRLAEEVVAWNFIGTKNPSAVLMSRIRRARTNDLTGWFPQRPKHIQLLARKESPTDTTLEPLLSNFLNPEKALTFLQPGSTTFSTSKSRMHHYLGCRFGHGP